MPILRSGSFVLYGYTLVDHGALLDGDTQYGAGGPSNEWSWQNFNTIFIIPFPTAAVYTGPEFLDTTTEGNGWSAGAPPPGFNIHTGFLGPSLHCMPSGCSGLGMLGTVQGAGLFNKCGATGYQNTDPLLVYIELLDFFKLTINDTVGLTSGGIPKTGPWSVGSPTPSGIYVSGGYDIIAWWWTTPTGEDPTKSPCGEPQDTHLVLAIDNPGGMEKLDPNDSNAAPIVVVTTITPNHGLTAGGVAVTIEGSGFGDDATVTFGGSAATSVVVHNQFKITCVSPAHAAGSTAVVVTNLDGGHN
jgi:hypothetical protein